MLKCNIKKHILIILSVLLLPIAVSAEEVSLPFFEDCASLDGAVFHSEKLTATPHTDEEVSFTDDFSFIQRTELSPQWLVYEIPIQCDLTVSTYFWDGDGMSHFNFYLSEDGEKFRQIKPSIKIHPKIENKWLTIDYKIKNTEDKFIKIEFQNLGGNSWNPAIRFIRGEKGGSEKFADVTDENMLDSLKLLNSLGILNGYDDGSYRPEETVTRAGYITAVAKLINAENGGGYTYFEDVAKEAWYTPYVNAGVENGLVTGASDGLFYPDRIVSYKEAVKILVTALGYGNYAETTGGYPVGYLSIAGELKLGKNVKDGDITRGDMVNLLANAFETRVMEQSSFGENIVYDKTVNALKYYHKINTVTSLLTDNGTTALTGDSSVRKTQIRLGFETYSCGDEGIKKLLGHRVKLYADDEGKVIHFTDKTEDVKVISADDIEEFNNSEIAGGGVRVSITPNTRIIYNGEFLASAGDCNLADYCPADGEAEIIGSPAETVKIKSYTAVVAQSGGSLEKEVYGRFSGKLMLNLPDCRQVTVIRDGEKTDDLSYNADEVLQIARSINGRATEIIISTEAVIGTLDSLSERELIIDGKPYAVSAAFGNTPQPQVGEWGYFYFDRQGKILYADIKSSPYENYGYVIKTGSSGNISDDMEIKLFTGGGKIEIFTLKQGVALPPEGKTVKYSLARDGKISSLSVENADYKSISLYHNSLFAARYFLSDETKIIVIPEDKTYEEGYFVRKKDFFKATNRYNIEIYGTDEQYVPEAVIVHEKDSQMLNITNYNEIVIIREIEVTLDETGNEVYMLTFSNGTDIKISARDIEDITAIGSCKNKILHPGDGGTPLAVGDILQYGTDEKGEINAVRFLHSADTTDFYEWVTGEWGTVTADFFFGETAVFLGKVLKKYDGRIIAESTGGERNFSTTSAVVYEIENGRLKKTDISEINADDKVVLALLSGTVKIILKK